MAKRLVVALVHATVTDDRKAEATDRHSLCIRKDQRWETAELKTESRGVEAFHGCSTFHSHTMQFVRIGAERPQTQRDMPFATKTAKHDAPSAWTEGLVTCPAQRYCRTKLVFNLPLFGLHSADIAFCLAARSHSDRAPGHNVANGIRLNCLPFRYLVRQT